MFMIEPPPASRITGIAALHPRNTPSDITALAKRNCSSVVVSGVATTTTPALLTSTFSAAEGALGLGDHCHPARLVAHVVDGERGRSCDRGIELARRPPRPAASFTSVSSTLAPARVRALRIRASQARGGPGDDRDLACETVHGVRPSEARGRATLTVRIAGFNHF